VKSQKALVVKQQLPWQPDAVSWPLCFYPSVLVSVHCIDLSSWH
jgi:hypothetical protein